MGKLNRRDFLRLSAGVATGAILASCQPAAPAAPAEKPAEKAAEKPAEKAAEKPAERLHIKYYDWGGETYPRGWQEVGDQFNDAHPELNVEYFQNPDQWREKVLAMFVAKSDAAPDIISHCCDDAKKFYEAGQLLDMKPYWDTMPADDVADFPENQIVFWTDKVDGALTATPKYQGNLVVFVNTGFAEEAGVTFPTKFADHWSPDEYREAIAKLTTGDRGTPEAVFGGGRYMWSDRNTPFLYSNDGHFINPDDDTECWLSKPEAMECLNFWSVLINEDHSIPLPTEVAGETSMRRLFPVKKLASMEEGAWAIRDMSDNAPFPWDIMPTYSWPVRTTTLATTDGWSIWKESPHPDAVWELIVFLMGKTYGKAIAKAHFLQPARLSLQSDYIQIIRQEAPVLEDVNLELFKEAREGDLGWPMELYYDQTAATEILRPVFEQIMYLGKTTVDEAIPGACQETTEKMQELKARGV
jgi:multiple sugar transport system substrate-binding protein